MTIDAQTAPLTDAIRSRLVSDRERLEAVREIFLANLIMIGEIPAPTFQEERRAQFMLQRYSEAGLSSSSIDEAGNAVAVYPGRDRTRNLLAVAHLDTIFPSTLDHTVKVEADRVIGPGVADNSLGLAAVATLPRILSILDIELQSGLLLMGASRSLGRGNLDGLRFFLKNKPTPIEAGLCIEGAQLGRISYTSIGMSRGEIHCNVPEEYDWEQFGASGAIYVLHDVISGLLAIPTPRRPRTQIILGNIEGGSSFNRLARQAVLRYEVQSEDNEQLEQVERAIALVVEEAEYKTQAQVRHRIVARRDNGGIPYSHPMVQCAREFLKELGVEPSTEPSTSEVSAFIDHDIPAITIGLSRAENLREPDECVWIDPLFTGLAQMVGLLLALDGGVCHVD